VTAAIVVVLYASGYYVEAFIARQGNCTAHPARSQ